MTYPFNTEDINQIFLNNYKNYQQIFPKNKGYYEFNHEKISQDISVYKNKIVSNDDICMVCDQTVVDSFFINILIKGSVYLKMDKNTSLVIKPNKTLTTFAPKATEEFLCKKDTNFQSISFKISKDYIRKSQEKDFKFEDFEILKTKTQAKE